MVAVEDKSRGSAREKAWDVVEMVEDVQRKSFRYCLYAAEVECQGFVGWSIHCVIGDLDLGRESQLKKKQQKAAECCEGSIRLDHHHL